MLVYQRIETNPTGAMGSHGPVAQWPTSFDQKKKIRKLRGEGIPSHSKLVEIIQRYHHSDGIAIEVW